MEFAATVAGNTPDQDLVDRGPDPEVHAPHDIDLFRSCVFLKAVPLPGQPSKLKCRYSSVGGVLGHLFFITDDVVLDSSPALQLPSVGEMLY